MLISQLVTANENLTLVNDVQLSWYPDKHGPPTNEELAGAFMWTSEKVADQNSLSSLDWLDLLRLSFLAEKPTNRFVMVATYGRGKSHLALALANYFGQPAQSPIVAELLQNIERAAPERGASFRDFKARRGAFLVVRISGDDAGSLNEQFLRGLERALSEHPAIAQSTTGTTLPFWYARAEQVLGELSDAEAEAANDALAAHQMDLPRLLEQVQARAAVFEGLNVHDLCVDAVRAAKRVEPSFGGEVSLQEAVLWACDTFCSVDPEEGKPCGGLVVLFDEFARFIEKYARNPRGDSLQKLLNGVQDRPGLAAFLALSQREPGHVAKDVAEGLNPQRLSDLQTQLGRLPQDDQHALHTSLENVLSKYLQQDATRWDAQMQGAAWSAAIESATDDVMSLFPTRYDGGARWSVENVQAIITEGCFPLHPLTTALLSDLQFQSQTQGARSIMTFLRDVLRDKHAEPVEKNGRPNWAWATDIVRIFGDMVNGASGSEHGQFQNALGRVGNEATEVQVSVLRAILLHDVGKLKPRAAGGFVPLISMLSGFEEGECRSALEEMANAGHLRYDDMSKRWLFPPAGEDDRPVEREVERRVQNHALDAATLLKLRDEWGATLLAPHKADGFNLEWGNADDWAAAPLLFTRETFTPVNLRKSIEKPATDMFKGLSLPPRGYAVHLLALHDDDIEWARQNAAQVLDEALRGQSTPPPVVVCLPSEAMPSLPRLILQRRALAAFSNGERRDYGANAVKSVEERYDKQLALAIEKLLKGASTFEVPQPYRAHVSSAFAGAILSGPNLSLALRECYNQAYASRPPALLPQYSAGKSSQFRTGVKAVAEQLTKNAVGSLEADMKGGPGRDLVFSGARPLVLHWTLLAGQGYGVQAPAGRAKAGWEVLDKAFAQGKGAVPLSRVIEKLLSAPYGYDAPGLTILLCAWYGLNSRLLSVTSNSAPHSMEAYWGQLNRPWDFLCMLSQRGVAWSRQDIGKDERQANDIIERVQQNQPIAPAQAKADAESLEAFAGDDRQTNAPLREQAAQVALRLRGDMDTASRYDAQAGEIESKIEGVRRVLEVSGLLKRIGELPTPGLVPPSQMEASKLEERARAKMERLVEDECAQWEKLKQLTDFKHHQEQLREVEADLRKTHNQALQDRVKQAQVALEARKGDLEARGHDAATVADVASMQHLSTLKAWREALLRLDQMSPRAEETRDLIQAARSGLQSKIDKRVAWVDGLGARLEELKSSAEAQAVRDDIPLRRGQLEGTLEDERAQAAWGRAGRLLSTWEALAQLQRRVASADREGPAALDAVESRLGEIEGAGDESFNGAARNALGALRREMAGARAQGLEQARRRLANHAEALRHGGDAHALSRALNVVPPWLDEAGRGEWRALQQAVQARVDEDHVGVIVSRFRSLRDPSQRAACLSQLQEAQREIEAQGNGGSTDSSGNSSSNGHSSLAASESSGRAE